LSIAATEGGSLAGKTFAELRMPAHCYPAALLRGSEVIMPGRGVRIAAGDTLLVIAGADGECRLEELS